MADSGTREAIVINPKSKLLLTTTARGEERFLIVPVFLMGDEFTKFPEDVFEGFRRYHRVIRRRTRYSSSKNGTRLDAHLCNRDLWEALHGMNAAGGVVIVLANGSESRSGQVRFEAAALYLKEVNSAF